MNMLCESCWEWVGCTNRNGYGRVWRNRRTVMVHRLVYEATYGDIPAGLVLDHLCRNRRCVNPAHLEPVTVRTNTLRGIGPTAMRWRSGK